MLVPVMSMSGSATSVVEDPEEETDEALRDRGRVESRWMRCDAVGQRGREGVGGLEVGLPPLLLVMLLRLLRLLGEERAEARSGLMAGLGKEFREE
jgi:hypothetical protein